MPHRLFVYYRIPKADIATGLSSARLLADRLNSQGLGKATLYQREEADKPYFTLMEEIRPASDLQGDMAAFSLQVEQLAATCFSTLQPTPARHTEVFTELEPPCA